MADLNAAAPVPASPTPVDGSPPSHAASDHPQHDGLAQILTRQWPVVVTSTVLALLLGLVYYVAAPHTVTASAKLRVSPMNPQEQVNGAAAGGSADREQEDYLDTECVVIKSDAVLALALDALRDAPPLRGVANPLDVLRAGVDATVAKKGKVIEVTFDSRKPDDAKRVVGAVVDAYQAYNLDYWKAQSKQIMTLLRSGNVTGAAQIKELEDRLQALQLSAQSTIDTDPEHSPAHLQVASLRDAKFQADREAIAARTAYQEAAKSILGDPAKRAAFEQRARIPTFNPDPQAALRKVQDELQRQEAQLSDARNQYLPQHPLYRQLQARVDQLTVDAVLAAKQWQDVAEGNQQALAHSLADAQRAELESEQTRVEYKKVQDQLKVLRDQQDRVMTQMGKTELAEGAGAVNVSVLDFPQADTAHQHPSKTKVLALALAIGVLAGAGIGCARDWGDDRFRNLAAVRVAAAAPVLGAIPAIPSATAASAADRGRVVHFDPFGDASESYRTLRTALQFGLPTGTRTLLVTSPMSGDGKSTLVSNLAIAMAQANRRVLIVDADLRAPVQHRLHNVSDRAGLATVLDGTDTLDEAIQHTDIDGLDVLPAGPIPSNPAELINTVAFNDYLNELADRYDIVLVDSPPITAVTDARILAALIDASLLVVRLGTSTRRQTEAARDALRGVGARLVGVAVNSVTRRGGASATGYYGRTSDGQVAPPAAAEPSPVTINGAGRIGHNPDPLTEALRAATQPPARH